MKLYFSKGACSLVVRIIIHELKLDAEYVSVDLTSKKTADGTDYLQINPKGSVPALLLDNQQLLTENAVILQFLADKYNARELLPDLADQNRYKILEWLNYMSTDIHKSFGPLFLPQLDENIKESIFKPLLIKKYKVIDAALANSEYIAADHFTLPDAYLFVTLRWIAHFKIDIKQFKHLPEFFARLKQRPSVQQSLNEEKM